MKREGGLLRDPGRKVWHSAAVRELGGAANLARAFLHTRQSCRGFALAHLAKLGDCREILFTRPYLPSASSTGVAAVAFAVRFA